MPSHGYTVLNVKKLSKGAKLVEMLNPLGTATFNGKWRRDSHLWTNLLKNEAKLNQMPQSHFYVELDEYLRHF